MTKLNSLSVIAASFVLVANISFAQPAVQAGCMRLEGGTVFCPASTPTPTPAPVVSTPSVCCGGGVAVPTPIPAAGPCCLGPLADRITRDATEAGQVVDALDKLRGTPTPSNPVSPSFGGGGISPWWWLVGIAFVGGLVWLALRHRPQTAPQQGTGQVEGNFLVVRHPLQVTANPLHLNATVNVAGAAAAAPAPAQPGVAAPPAPAPVGTSCPGCATPKPTLVAQFCANCGHTLPAILFVLLLAGLGQFGNANAQTLAGNDIRYRCQVNGVEGLCTPPAVTVSPALAPPQAPKPAVRRTSPPRPAPAVPATLTADEILRAVRDGVVEGMKASQPSSLPATTPAPAPAPAATLANQPAAASASSVEALARRLGDAESKIVETRDAHNSVIARVGEVQNRLKAVEGKQADDHQTLASLGAAVVTRSKSNACAAYRRLHAQGMVTGKGPRACPLGE